MAWIKRNLYFLIGTIVAVLLLGGAGWYLWSKLQLNDELLGKLNEQYAELDRLNKENPHPGRGAIDNIKKAREEKDQLRDLQKKSRQFFVRAPAIPEGTKVSGQDFTAALRLTIDQLQRGATNASVGIPPDYSFSFEAEKHMVRFSGSLDPLAVQLGEVKAICDILFQAKINALDALRRERVSPDDTTGPASDYVNQRSTTNELGVIAPYEISFRCFTAELAAVLAGFASSPDAFLVKTLYVELAPAVVVTETPVVTTPQPQYIPQPAVPTAAQQAAESASRDAAMMARYGLGPGGGRSKMASGAAQPIPQPQPVPGVLAPGAPAAPKGGLSTVLDERQLKVTMHINLVKLAPQK
jgi:hypothetical protein